MLNTPFSPWPSYTDEEIAAVSEVLASNRVNYWTGEECREFEWEFASWCGTKHAVALANGTLALEAALKALGVGPGDEVIVTPRTFFASASCIVNIGATPVFADVDADSQNITAETIRAVLTKKTKAIICVHLGGWPCNMDPIMALAEEHNLKVIEDCAQAHGAKYKGRMVGSLGHVAAWSFCQDKIMTTGGEGGMLTTNDKDIWSYAWSWKDHGKSWEAVYERKHSIGYRWVHDSFGSNWRMIEMQAVIGRIQLKHINEWITKRAVNAQRIRDCCRKYAVIRVPKIPTGIQHAYYKFYVFIQPQHLSDGWSRDHVIEEMTSRGIPCYQGSCPEVYLERAFSDTDFQPLHRLPVAKELGETSLMFLVHPTLTEKEMSEICQVIDEVLKQASK